MDEARIVETEAGKVVEGDGWFVLNAGEVAWQTMPNRGVWSMFEHRGAPFGHYGFGIHVLMPGEANGLYHAESAQEDFLVLSGECIAVVEGEERRLRQWDLLHCPPGTEHITIGAGDGPCAILMVGARFEGREIRYPVNEVAARHGASVTEPVDRPRDAYAGEDRTRTNVRAPWPG